MATSAGSYYATQPLAGTDFSKVRSSAQGPEFPIKIRVPMSNAKVAMYVVAGTAVGPGISGSCGSADTGGTISASAGAWLSMAGVTVSVGEWFWVRSSADVLVP